MAKEFREHLYTGSLLAAAALGGVGLVLLWDAVAFEGYIGALLMLSVAAVCLVAGRELAASGAEADRVASPRALTPQNVSGQERD